ncbi:MAG: hypothetical protein ACOC6D_02945 [Atribacterota bacterium]
MFFALFKTFMILIAGTFSGYFCQKLIEKNHWLSSESKKELTIFLQKLGMIWVLSITYIGSLWIFKIESIVEIISMPFVGVISTITGGFFAVMIAKYHHLNRIDTGSMFSCGYFSNNVTLGGMICFFYLGEEGYALVPIYTFLMRFLYFGVGYPIAHVYGDNLIEQKKPKKEL